MNSYIGNFISQKYLAFSALGTQDLMALIHPALVVIFVFPMVGIVTNFAWQTRQRRLAVKKGKSKIPAIVGKEHVNMGRWLAASVVVVSLIALAYSIIYKSFIKKGLWMKNTPQAILILLMFAATIASLVLLLRARPKLWRGVFCYSYGHGTSRHWRTRRCLALSRPMVLVTPLFWHHSFSVDDFINRYCR